MTEAAAASHAPILMRLRTETRQEHSALDAMLGLAEPSITHEVYCHTLVRFHGYYAPLEAAIEFVSGWADRGVDLDERRKLPLLEADLASLGLRAPSASELCRTLPRIDSAARAFGSLYVLEGATLGGQLISRHVQQALGITCHTGSRFFHGYGERTGPMWQSFRASLTAFVTTPAIEDDVVHGAIETFRTLHVWCARGTDA